MNMLQFSLNVFHFKLQTVYIKTDIKRHFIKNPDKELNFDDDHWCSELIKLLPKQPQFHVYLQSS